jgi:hypothetical protein
LHPPAIVCAQTSQASATFSRAFTGTYQPGQPYAVGTVSPDGGESFAATGILIDVYVRNCQGNPIAGLPAQEVVLNSGVCMCPGRNMADAATDLAGHTQFTGMLRAGGCVNGLSVYADGVLIGEVPVRTNCVGRRAPRAWVSTRGPGHLQPPH